MYTKDSNFTSLTEAIKWPLRILYAIAKLPAHVSAIYQNRVELDDTVGDIDRTLSNMAHSVEDAREAISSFEARLASLDHRSSNIEAKIHTLRAGSLPAASSVPSEGNRFADNHDLDSFYVGFEDKFRGGEKEIEARVAPYPERFKNTGINFTKYPVVDLGCGRGELLTAFHAQNIRAIGLDINYDMVERAKSNGLEAVQGDAIKYLGSLENASIGGVAGMHLIEHIPFAELYTLFQECFRVLRPGGLVIFETPNPENLMVGIYAFHMDPSHLKPLPPPLTGYALESAGFIDVEILRVHDAKENRPSYEDPLLNDLSYRVYGPLDYAAIAKKPGTIQRHSAKKNSK